MGTIVYKNGMGTDVVLLWNGDIIYINGTVCQQHIDRISILLTFRSDKCYVLCGSTGGSTFGKSA